MFTKLAGRRPTHKFRKVFERKMYLITQVRGRKFGGRGGFVGGLKIFKGFGSFALQKNE